METRVGVSLSDTSQVKTQMKRSTILRIMEKMHQIFRSELLRLCSYSVTIKKKYCPTA